LIDWLPYVTFWVGSPVPTIVGRIAVLAFYPSVGLWGHCRHPSRVWTGYHSQKCLNQFSTNSFIMIAHVHYTSHRQVLHGRFTVLSLHSIWS